MPSVPPELGKQIRIHDFRAGCKEAANAASKKPCSFARPITAVMTVSLEGIANAPLAIESLDISRPTMTYDQQRWTEAWAVIEKHGDRWSIFIAERWIAVAKAGDEAGIARWREIMRRRDQLIEGTIQ